MPGPISLETPLADVDGLAARSQKALGKSGFHSVEDLVLHFPRRYEDRRRFDGFPDAETPAAVCLHGRIVDCGLRRFGYRRYAEIKVEDARAGSMAQPVFCRWFNMPWIARAFAVGQEIVLFGRVKAKGSRLLVDHPDFEIIEPESEGPSIHMNRIVPVYPLRDGLPQKSLREALHDVLDRIDWAAVADVVPPGLIAEAPDEPAAGGTSSRRGRALRDIHFPESAESARAAREFLALEEFFSLQLNVLRRRQRMLARTGTAHRTDGGLLDRWRSGLSFSLTAAQDRAIREVTADMAAARPMNRLLQGDVGSGKTAVALAAALIAVESGSQVAVMAPTQLLAEQHFRNFCGQLEPLGVRVSLRTSGRSEESYLPLFDGGGDPQIVVGTHALLFEDGLFDRLGLVVIDEQHKFGVAQRARLVRQGRAPDVLVMTATPIPRTLALTLYGDLDVSVLDEMPPGRGKVTTALRAGVDLAKLVTFVREQIEKGRQAFIVYPLVEDSDKLEVKAATSEHATWQERLPGVAVGLLHGRMKPDEKDETMNAFRRGATKVLVSTTVVEVGVDVPNANLMLVFNAERFGLVQLHQLRGRIGRAGHSSYCVFICSDKDPAVLERLRILEETRDGFRIAEADLRQRGPGELLGERQSGLPALRLGDLAADAPLVQRARDLAATVIRNDPGLDLPENRHLRRILIDDPLCEAGN